MTDQLRYYRGLAGQRLDFGKLSSFRHESIEQRSRKLVLLPAKFRMPLHAEHEAVAARILHRLDDSVRSPGRSHQFPSQRLDRLMMMAVDRRVFTTRQFAEQAV